MIKSLLSGAVVLAMAFTSQAQDLCSNLQAMYAFNNNANNHSGTQPFSNPTYDVGRIAQGLLITGSARAATTSLVSGSGRRTVAMWIWRSSNTVLANSPGIFYYGGINNQPGERFGAYYNTDGSLTFQGFGSGYDHQVQNSTTSTGQWAHIALTYNGSDVSVYINGTLRDSWAVALNTAGSTLYLGGNNTFAVYDDLRIYGRVLNATEIQYLYSNPEAQPCCVVNIPDANFKDALVNHTQGVIDINGNGEIECSEAEAFTGVLNVHSKNISDLTGVEAFTNAIQLLCSNNQLTSLDVSSNTALTSLQCGGNQLTSLDVSNNTALTNLNCETNNLTSLDVSHNTALAYFFCSNNTLTSLNLANGNNTDLWSLWAHTNPNLTCIKVDNAAYSTANWVNGTVQQESRYVYDAGLIFSENCTPTGITITTKALALNIYPNPAKEILNVEVQEATNIKIVNLVGATVAAQQLHKGRNSIDLSLLSNGIYFLQTEAHAERGSTTLRFVKQ